MIDADLTTRPIGKDMLVVFAPTSQFDLIEDLVQPVMRSGIEPLDHTNPFLAGMCRFHLGWVDRDFAPVATSDRGKRMRPEIALLCCQAAGGALPQAAPLAAAIELLHNFTLVHDDIQDRSPTRRHRATVWSIWGESQAINTGDALFAAAHLALFQLVSQDVAAERVLRIADAFERMTIEIVAGQVADLSFETRSDVHPDEYLTMIAGKTAAIVRFAAWAGAEIANAPESVAHQFGAFGLALGLGFQVQDDLLGIWASAEATGKAAADDIRRKKKSLPILMLHERALADDRTTLERIYAEPEIDAKGIDSIFAMMASYAVRPQIEAIVRNHHDQAIAALLSAAPTESVPRSALLRRIELLASRSN